MKIAFVEEPELEFGGGGTHIDIRYGLMTHGPLDLGDATAPTQLRIGIIGTAETVRGFRLWLERCRDGIAAKESKLSNLFPAFLGFSGGPPLYSSLVFHERWCATIRQREIDAVLSQSDGDETVRHAVQLFLGHGDDLVEHGGPMVLVCVPPRDLLAAVDGWREGPPPDPDQQELDDAADLAAGLHVAIRRPFHDVLKAEGMRLGVPIQMVRPSTYTGQRTRQRRTGKGNATLPLQDEATRAWNIHTALYYKAGGIPWRLLRSASELLTCFVGISFFKSAEGNRLLTSVAQVFNERGEGVIVKGGTAKVDKDDHQPHLDEVDACQLLKTAIQVFRREHRTAPARVVVHKTSNLTSDEMAGFKAACEEHAIDVVDLVSMRRSFTRLFREGTYPPVRGTLVELQADKGLLYTRGSVNFFATYPGLYVPRPLEFCTVSSESGVGNLAAEILALSKLNWNNTQFDGGEPITVRAARRVGDILKRVPDGGVVQPGFRYFM